MTDPTGPKNTRPDTAEDKKDDRDISLILRDPESTYHTYTDSDGKPQRVTVAEYQKREREGAV